jgi:hypothetical protein
LIIFSKLFSTTIHVVSTFLTPLFIPQKPKEALRWLHLRRLHSPVKVRPAISCSHHIQLEKLWRLRT